MGKYTTSFKSIGTVYDESLILMGSLQDHDWDFVRAKAFEHNLLKKKSSRWIDMLCSYFERRYLKYLPLLPNPNHLIKFINANSIRSSRTQTLYQYICEAHPFIDSLILEFVAPNFNDYFRFRLTKEMYFDHLVDVSKDHPEVAGWAEYTNKKLQRDFFAFLRQSGLMEEAPGITVSRFVLRPEVFGFFSYGLLENNVVGKDFFDSKIWKRFFLTQSMIEDFLTQAQVRGWLSFQISGGISEIVPVHDSLEDWINAFE